MFEFTSNITSETINEILSLRYATNQNLIFSKLTPNNFLSNNNTPSIEKIEQLLQNSIVNTIPKFSKVSIALSGGVDSTIVLAMLDKVNLDLEIDALSIKFSNSVDETILASKIAHIPKGSITLK